MLDLLAADTLKHAPPSNALESRSAEIHFRFRHLGGRRGRSIAVADPGRSRIPRIRRIAAMGGSAEGSEHGGRILRITVDPGNKLVRRNADLPIRATLVGFQAPEVRLMARYKSSTKWEEANMLPRASDSSYEFLFAAVPEPVEYYVEAAGVKSKTYKLDVIDLPASRTSK